MSNLLDEFLEQVKKENLVVNYVQVKQREELIAEYSRLDAKVRLNTWSVSKSFVSAGVGIALKEGLISLEEKICDAFKQYLPEQPDENLTGITVRHLLTMTSGLEHPLFFDDGIERYRTKDWIHYFFHASFIHKPGENFLYSNFNTYMLGCLIEKRCGTGLMDYLRTRLFEPMGIYSPDWTRCPMGHAHAANGLYANIDELSNFGEMLLHQGSFCGKQLVPANYLEEATKNQTGSVGPEHGYGYQFWINEDECSFRADGRFGQYVVVLPKKEAVIAVQSLDSRSVFPVVWNKIVQKL